MPSELLWFLGTILLLFGSYQAYRKVILDFDVLKAASQSDKNRKECVKHLYAASSTVRDARKRVQASVVEDQQIKIIQDTWHALRGYANKLHNLGCTNSAFRIALEFSIDSRLSPPNSDWKVEWFDGLERAITEALDDVRDRVS